MCLACCTQIIWWPKCQTANVLWCSCDGFRHSKSSIFHVTVSRSYFPFGPTPRWVRRTLVNSIRIPGKPNMIGLPPVRVVVKGKTTRGTGATVILGARLTSEATRQMLRMLVRAKSTTGASRLHRASMSSTPQIGRPRRSITA